MSGDGMTPSDKAISSGLICQVMEGLRLTKQSDGRTPSDKAISSGLICQVMEGLRLTKQSHLD